MLAHACNLDKSLNNKLFLFLYNYDLSAQYSSYLAVVNQTTAVCDLDCLH